VPLEAFATLYANNVLACYHTHFAKLGQ
jgi:hypothetical protein